MTTNRLIVGNLQKQKKSGKRKCTFMLLSCDLYFE